MSHPNTPKYHIRWMQVFFYPEAERLGYQLAQCEFTAHGESAQGANEGSVYTHHAMSVDAMIKNPGTIYALSFCNIHGLWENSKEVNVG